MTGERSWGERGLSSVVGFVLIIGLVVGGMTLVLALGGAQLTDIEEAYSTEQAENTMASFDSDASLVALGTSDVRHVDLGTNRQSEVVVQPDTGRLSITLIGSGGNRTEIANTTLGEVRNEIDDTDIVYQGGGVWRHNPGGNTGMVSPPEFHYRGQTLTFPIVTVDGEEYAGDGGLTIESNGSVGQYPNQTLSNPVAGATVRVEVTSRYHEGWENYFRTRTQGEVEHFPTQERVAVNLTAPLETIFDSSIATTMSGPGALNPSSCVSGGGGGGGGGGPGGGPGGGGPPGHAGGGPPAIAGPGVVGTIANLGGFGLTSGLAMPPSPNGFECPTTTGANLPSASPLVEKRITECESGGCQDLSASLPNLDNGTYYHDGDITIPDGTTLDTKDGNISIVVDGTVSFGTGGGPGAPANQEILGDNGVTMYVKDGIDASGNPSVNTGGDPSDLLVLAHSNATSLTISGTTQFTGLLYGPNTDFRINGGGAVTNNVFGAVVAETGNAGGNGYVEYDETLDPVMEFDFNPELTYLHVTENSIEVGD